MMNAASTSLNPSIVMKVGEVYPYPSHVIAPNFVTMKLSGEDTYNVWETQILCLLTSHQMNGFIDGQFPSPAGIGKGKVGEMKEWIISDSLVKGWILGSLSDRVAKKVVNHLTDKQKKTVFTAKELWDELQLTYGPSAASISNPGIIVDVGEAYPYPSVIAPNFVTTKLSGKDTYNVWETQILCLLTSHQMDGFIEGHFPNPAGIRKGKVGEMQEWIISDSLVKGWILASLSDGVAKKVLSRLKHKQKNTNFTAKDLLDEQQQLIHKKTYFTAKDLWDELQHSYGPSDHEQAAEAKLTRQDESVIEVNTTFEHAKSKDNMWKRRVYMAVLKGQTSYALYLLRELGLSPWDKITNNGNTLLHVAVFTKNDRFLEKLLKLTPTEKTLLDLINYDGSTLLHIAAIGGNIEVVDILVERNPELLLAKDNEGHTPLALSFSNMHTNTSYCLFKHMKEKGYDALFKGRSGDEIVVLAISCQDFSLANMIIKDYPDTILYNSDTVLTALAQNFPRELKSWERRGWRKDFSTIVVAYSPTLERLRNYFDWPCGRELLDIFTYFFYVLCKVATMFYGFLKVLVRLFVKDTSQIHRKAEILLDKVCREINKKDVSSYHQRHTNSIFEATTRNASTFIRRIMWWFPDAIWSTNEDGHNFIQYSVINRSEKIYSLLYEMSENKNIHKTIKDSTGNNLLHLAARLAPTTKLNLTSGAALQIQRELQWFKEVERFVCPLNRVQKNLDDETPAMVFTREHKHLVIEGESWIKKTAESYTITAALIVTIVFAAAITVPGGNIQESGIPIFTNTTAFTVFSISDAISLFTAVTSLLMFLSILTARCAEQDFLRKLPTKLIIGLTMLFLSTTAMIIAFGATLFLVFGQRNSLMLNPIGALTCLPITSFVTLQCPLIIELISATYGGDIFVREHYGDVFY